MAQSKEERDRLYLQENDAFLRFLRGIDQKREAALAEMAEADDTALRKLSGQITAFTDILNDYEYQRVGSRRTG